MTERQAPNRNRDHVLVVDELVSSVLILRIAILCPAPSVDVRLWNFDVAFEARNVEFDWAGSCEREISPEK